VTNQFGSRLFQIFFKTYTEKVWGMSCRDISADWAAQRIKGLSLASAIINALTPKRPTRDRSKVIKTLIDSFRYPRRGPGMMWEAAARKTILAGGTIHMGVRVTGLQYDSSKKDWTVTGVDSQGKRYVCIAQHVISSAPIRELVQAITPAPASLTQAKQLKYRDFVTVALILDDRDLFDDNWIYIHDPSVKVGRVQNFKSWSPELIPDPSKCCYGLEYFCFEGDGLWSSSDESLIELAKTELEILGLARRGDILDGCVVRQAKAYPVYDEDYSNHVEAVRRDLETNFPNLHLVGRNGMHKYNNQDHAMMTAMLTAENIIRGQNVFDIWQVNQDAEYHESGTAGATGLRDVPRKVASATSSLSTGVAPQENAAQ
jgi:protoporphyrinogen oxidase